MSIVKNIVLLEYKDNSSEIDIIVTLSKILMALSSECKKALGINPSLRLLTIFILQNFPEVSGILSEKISEGCELKHINIEVGSTSNPLMLLIFTLKKPTS
ncbi:MAG: hypothetical protein L3J07_02360 [Candidatus Magasanikbacteria bacterium]|nr:hypothetical protein [Candidatus Magasanikbacteria bacterium]